MTRQIPWLRVFAEGVVIVVSILLAFWIDAWWEGRQEDTRASAYLTALLEEVAANHEELDRTVSLTERAIANNRSARNLLKSGWTEVPKDSILGLIMRASYIWILRPITNVHDQLVATGDLRLLSPEVSDALSTWRRALRSAETQDRGHLDFRVTSATPYLVNETAYGEFISLSFGRFENDPIRFENDLERLSRDRRLDNILMEYLLHNGSRLSRYEEVREALRAVDEVVQRDLDRGLDTH